MKKVTIVLLSAFSLFSCATESSEVSNNVKKKIEKVTPLTENTNEEASKKVVTLEKTNWKDIKGSDYEIIEKVVTKKVTIGSIREVDIWFTTEGLVIDFVDENGLFTGAKLLPTSIINEYNLQVKADLQNAIGAESSANELVVTWNTMDGNNGFEDGHEMEINGLFIIDLEEVKLVQDFIYVDHQMSYSGNPTEADLKDEDYHAKKAESTDFEICSYSSKIKVILNKLIITDYYEQQEGKSKCELNDFSGTYVFDKEKGTYSK
jgi:hypothetical protein